MGDFVSCAHISNVASSTDSLYSNKNVSFHTGLLLVGTGFVRNVLVACSSNITRPTTSINDVVDVVVVAVVVVVTVTGDDEVTLFGLVVEVEFVDCGLVGESLSICT